MHISRRLLALGRDARGWFVLTVLFGLLVGFLTIGQARGLSLLVARVFLGGADLAAVTGLLRFLLALIALRALLAWAGEVTAGAVAARVKDDLRGRLFDRLLALGPAYTRGERTGELGAAAVEGIEALDAYFSQYLPQLAVTALVPFSVLIFVFPLDWVSGLVLLLTAPLIPFFMLLIGRAAESLTRRQYATLGRLSAHFLDSLQGLVTLKQFGRAREHAASITEASDRFRDVTLSVLRITFLSALVLELLATLGTAVVAVEVGLRLLYGYLSFDRALFLLLLAPEFYVPLRMLGLRFHSGMSGTTAARRIFGILDTPGLSTADGSRTADGGLSAIVMHSVSYTYPGESQPVLREIDLEIRAGQHVALVGPSGAGKSTLAALLLRFIEPTSGEISVIRTSPTAGKEGWTGALADFSRDAWRSGLAWVPQAPFLFHDTISANLRIARPEATQTELDTALRAAHLDGFVRSLPLGGDTLIGEEGTRLSGGQAQRLALARAFLKDAPFLILDEPTSSLDPETELMLADSVRRLMQGRTVLTIAHRLNTVARADRIVVLQEGRVVETGTHRELLMRNGVYVRMVGREPHPAWVAASAESSLPEAQPEEVDDGVPTSPAQPCVRIQRSKILPRLLGFLSHSWDRVALSLLLAALTVGANVGLMGASTWLIASAALQPSIAELQVAIVGVRFFGIARGVFRYLERLVTHDVTFRLLSRLRTWFYEKLEPLAPAQLARYRSGDLLNRIVADVEILENFYVRAVGPPLAALVVVLLTAIFLAGTDPRLAGAYLLFAFLLGLGMPLLLLALGRAPGAALVARVADLRVRLVDGIQGLADLLAFGRGADYAARVRESGAAYTRLRRWQAGQAGLASAANVLLPGLGMWTVLALSIPQVADSRLEGVMLPVLVLVAFASFEAVTPLPLAAQTLGSSLAAARRLFEVVEERRPVPQRPVRALPPAVLSGAFSALEFAGVSFTYPGSCSPVLEDVSFTLTPGKRLAVVGPSGAGKSTLAGLLLGFWEPSRGAILLDGHDTREYDGDDFRRLVSVIAQRTHLFNLSIRDNLLLADPAAGPEQLQAAAQQARVHEFITGLDGGYATLVGERGVRLSGGERQRLAIARALLKRAPILLLDEPTANLDPLAARGILETLLGAADGRSLLLITHRLSGLEAMDEILVLERGRIVGRGTHAGLLRGGGLYSRMFALQERLTEDLS